MQAATQVRRFPNLCRLARDFLSIPVMSADVERLFSAAKLTVTDLRHTLTAETIRLFQLLRSWDSSPVLQGMHMVCIPFTILKPVLTNLQTYEQRLLLEEHDQELIKCGGEQPIGVRRERNSGRKQRR